MAPAPAAWRYERNIGPRGPRPADNLEGAGVAFNAEAAIRGELMARAAAAQGAAALGLPPPQPPLAGHVPAWRRSDADNGITPKITGHAPVLPARRKAEFLQRQQEQLQQLRRLQPEAVDDEPEAPKRSPEEQREHDAQVKALRTELASTSIHMQTLEQRRARLRQRLVDMGEQDLPPPPSP